MNNKILLLAFLFLFYACKETEDLKPVETALSPVVVLNEGNFRSGNASISLYDASSGLVQQKVFQSSNNGRPLGDIAQSAVEVGGSLFVVLNNSNKIEILNPTSFQSLGQITGFNSPRYILPIDGVKAYVSDLYQDEIYIVNLQSGAITGKIQSKGWVERMYLAHGKAFVCQVDSNQVWVIDSQTDQIVKKIKTYQSPNSIKMDGAGKLWVTCSGGINQSNPALIQIDPVGDTVVKVLALNDPSRSMGGLQFAPNGLYGYYLSGDLYRFSTLDSVLPSVPLIPANGRIFYGTGVHPVSGDIYLTDAVDYVQSGVLIRHNAAGIELQVSRMGLIPSYIHFR